MKTTKKLVAIALAFVMLCGTVAVFGQYTAGDGIGNFTLDITAKDYSGLNIWFQNLTWNSTATNAFDVYVNDELVADDVLSYYNPKLPVGSTYKVVPSSDDMLRYDNSQWGGFAWEGTLQEGVLIGEVFFVELFSYCVDLNTTKCAVDIYLNGELIQSQVTDHWWWHRHGDTITFKNFTPIPGYEYTGPAELTYTIEWSSIHVEPDSYFIPIS